MWPARCVGRRAGESAAERARLERLHAASESELIRWKRQALAAQDALLTHQASISTQHYHAHRRMRGQADLLIVQVCA